MMECIEYWLKKQSIIGGMVIFVIECENNFHEECLQIVHGFLTKMGCFYDKNSP